MHRFLWIGCFEFPPRRTTALGCNRNDYSTDMADAFLKAAENLSAPRAPHGMVMDSFLNLQGNDGYELG